MYINKLFPFIDQADFIRNVEEVHSIHSIFCPLERGEDVAESTPKPTTRAFKAYRVLPCNTLVLNESENIVHEVIKGTYGSDVRLNIIEMDYLPVAKRVVVDTVNGVLTASIQVNDAYQSEEIVTDVFVNAASNGTQILPELVQDVVIPRTQSVSLNTWASGFDSEKSIHESADVLDDLLADRRAGKSAPNPQVVGGQTDAVYDWLDSYFRLPENTDMKNGGREVVPLLIGPTAVFKSSTVKELCKKYDYRMVDFRVSFTSRLDYSGLFQIGEVDGEKFSYACPMEELVTCSDGFREYCRKAYDKVSSILTQGYIEDNKVSNGLETDSVKKELTEEQRGRLQGLLEQYKNYMRTPVLFFDEITRTKDNGVNGILVQLLNQKRFNNMTLNGCKFVAATNLNLSTDARHVQLKDDLDEMYDVNTDLDVAYSNRFMPLKVFPEDVKARWFDWANGEKQKNGKTVTNIHPMILEFLTGIGSGLVYNDTPVLDLIEEAKSDNEIKSQTFPNYRTWDMLSDYLYEMDEDYEVRKKDDPKAAREYRDTIINGLISEWAGKDFIKFLRSKGYKAYTSVHGNVADDVGDFLGSTLEAGVPALLIGPSSLGKTSRVHAYMKKVEKQTGLKPVLINVNLASMDTVDLMGMPVKQSLVDYVSGGDLEKLGLGSVGRELGNVVKEVSSDISYGMVDSLTLRAPDKTIKDRFQTALKEGREVILFFDECNRVKNPTVMSAMFTCISDYEFCHISFKNQKDKVKIVAACNMAFDDMDADAGDYSGAGSLDPALAARFSLYWKKRYDANDVQSWIDFMEDQKKEGNIDSTLIDFFKSLPTDDAIRIMASVEKRTIENAEPSTRTLFQMSKDIRSMRGHATASGYQSSLYNGKIIFDDMIRQEFTQVIGNQSDLGMSREFYAQSVSNFLDKVLEFAGKWEPALTGEKVDMGRGRIMSGTEIMDALQKVQDKLKDYLSRALTSSERADMKIYADTALDLADACQRLDKIASNKRKNWFTMYAGEDFANTFTDYFNSVFGTGQDEDITIEMLSDDSLIDPFMKKKKAEMARFQGNTDKMIDAMLDLMREFLSVHGETLPPKNYAKLVDNISRILPTSDNMATLLKRSDKTVEGVFKKGEETGTPWISSVLSCYPSAITTQDIENMRARMSSSASSQTSGSGKRRSRIL